MTTKQYKRFSKYVRSMLVLDLLEQNNPIVDQLCAAEGYATRPKLTRAMVEFLQDKIRPQTKSLFQCGSVTIEGTRYWKDENTFLRDGTPIGTDNLDTTWESIMIELNKHKLLGIEITEDTLLQSQQDQLKLLTRQLRINDKKFDWKPVISRNFWKGVPRQVCNHRNEHLGKWYYAEPEYKSNNVIALFNDERMFTITSFNPKIIDAQTFASLCALRIEEELSIYA